MKKMGQKGQDKAARGLAKDIARIRMMACGRDKTNQISPCIHHTQTIQEIKTKLNNSP